MSLYQSIKNFGKKGILVGGLVAMLNGCDTSPKTIEKNEDLTGDGIQDAMLIYKNDYRILFIGQGDGTFLRAKLKVDGDNGVKYFLTDDKRVYFFDGEIYRESPNIPQK